MDKFKINFYNLVKLIYIILLMISPNYLYYIGLKEDIIPAFDICIIYYLITYKNTNHVYLFMIGIFVDTMHGMPIGTSSFAFITSSILIFFLEKYMMLRQYYTNITIFIVYVVYIIGNRYIFISFLDDRAIDIINLVFHSLSTIATYPIIRFIINIIDKNDREGTYFLDVR